MGMNRTMLGRVVLGVAAGSLLAVPSLAQEDAQKGPPTAERIAEWKAESESLALFQSEEPVEFTLVANYDVINKDRDTLSTKEYWGQLKTADGKGGELILSMKLRTRGHFRLAKRNCSFVPLRLNFVKGEVKGTLFDGQDKVKLVTHCNSNSLYDEYVIREYLAQKAHRTITPRSFRSRLSKVTYVDSASGKVIDTRNGILMEHEDDVARRMEGQIVEIRRALFADVDPDQILEVAIFEAFLGNTDWSLVALHNIRLVQKADFTLYPIAYDLDFSGLVSTRYATPDPQLGIRSVRERLYRGPCRSMETLQPFLAAYLAKEGEIKQLYETFPGLEGRYRQDTKKFLDDWFNMLRDPRRAKFFFVDSCKNVPGV